MSLKTGFVLIAVGIVCVLIAGCIGQQAMYDAQESTRLQKQYETVYHAEDTASTKYGCPGCPSSFMDFAEDMCNRGGFENSTVTDGVNTLQCSEVQR